MNLGRATPGADAAARIAARLNAGDHRGAWVEMTRLVGLDPQSAECHVVANALDRLDAQAASLTEVKIALLANFTADPMVPVLAGHGVLSGLAIRSYLAPFNQWTQDALDPASGLFQFQPDVVILALTLDDLAPALTTDFLQQTADAIRTSIDDTVSRIEQALTAVRTRSSAKVLLHTMPPPCHPALGMIDAFVDNGQRVAIHRLNERLHELSLRLDDVYLVDVERLVSLVGEPRWHDSRMAALARVPFTAAAIHALSDEYLRYVRAFTGRVRKVLVTDLDDTLWGGIVGEVGPEKIRLGPEYPGSAYVALQSALANLHRRGVVLAINSRNNPDDALQVIDRHPHMLLRREHFAAMRINWQDKAANLVEIAEELGLGLDSFVYIDDSPSECDRIRAACPEVLVVELPRDIAARTGAIRRLGVFDRLRYTDEDRHRTDMYRANAQRRHVGQTAQSLEDFYRSLEMALVIEPLSPATLLRAADLTQRTNQFNLTTRRFTSDMLAAHLSDQRRTGFMFNLTDRFGEHGWIGLAVAERRDHGVTITDLMLSCRVLKRTVETAVLAFLIDWAREQGARAVEGMFVATARNGQTASLYTDHGFAALDSAEGERRFRRAVNPPLQAPPWIRVCGREAALS